MVILSLDKKICMTQLLLKETFDSFAFIEGEITTFNRFSIDGRLHKEFWDNAPAHDYSFWREVRDYCFSIIKGRQTPLGFKFILSLAPENFAAFLQENQLSYQPQELQGLYLNFRFDGTLLQCITGTSMHTFTMDKSIDSAWDLTVKRFFEDSQIPWEVMQ